MDDPVLLPYAVAGQTEKETTRHFRRSFMRARETRGISDKFGHSNCVILRELIWDPSWSKIDGILTVETVPGLNRHFGT
jgi:hypothetical protein